MGKLSIMLLIGLVAVGCTGSDAGELPPAAKPMTQAEIDAMPPQARAAMENAQQQGQKNTENRGQLGPPQ